MNFPSKARPLVEAIAAVCHEHGAKLSVHQNGHLHYRIELGGRSRLITTALTPSDHHAIHNARADARRAIRSMQNQPA
jgi:hypothetical protein